MKWIFKAVIAVMMLWCCRAEAAVQIYLEVTVTNVNGTTHGDRLTVNGDTRFATNQPAFSPTTFFLATNVMNRAKTNLYSHVQIFKFGAGASLLSVQDVSTNKFRLIALPDQTISFTITGTWGTGLLVTNPIGTNRIQMEAPANADISVFSSNVRTQVGSSIIKYVQHGSNSFEPAWAALQHFLNRSNQQSGANKTFYKTTNENGRLIDMDLHSVRLKGPLQAGDVGKIFVSWSNGPPHRAYYAPDTNGFLGLFDTNGAAFWIADSLGSGVYSDSMLLPWVDLKNAFPSKDVDYYNVVNDWGTINIFGAGTNRFLTHLAVHGGLDATGRVVKTLTNIAQHGIATNLTVPGNAEIFAGTASNLGVALLTATNSTLRHRTTIAGDLAFPAYHITTVANGENKLNIGTNTFIIVDANGTLNNTWQLGALEDGARDGRKIWIYFKTGFNVEVLNDSGNQNPATNRIYTLTGGTFSSVGNAVGEVFYDLDAGRWVFSWLSRGQQTDIMTRGSGAGSIIGNGVVNTNTAVGGFIAGGSNNVVAGIWGVIGGGSANVVSNRHSTIAGGFFNRILDTAEAAAVCVIGGGEQNSIFGGNTKHSTIAGGQSNVIDNSRYPTIGGGWENKIAGRSNQVIGGGWRNTNQNFNSTIAGGYKNSILYNAAEASFDQGSHTIGGGYQQRIFGGNASGIATGYENVITYVNFNTHQNSFIGGGSYNGVMGSVYSSIVGGQLNSIGDSENAAAMSFIAGGITNRIAGGTANSIVGGSQNYIGAFEEYGFIGVGYANTNDALYHCFIGGGAYNYIFSGSTNGILWGHRNMVDNNNAYVWGNDLTNAVENSIDLGFSQATKFTVGASETTVRGELVLTPSALQSISAAGAILANATRVRVAGNGGAVTANGTTSIADGTDGQILHVVGTSDANTVQINDNSNVQTAGGVNRVLGNRDILVLMFDATNGDWAEVSFSNN